MAKSTEEVKDMEIVEAEVIVTGITTMKDGKENKFNAYKIFTKTGKKMDLKFVRDLKNLPTENCIMVVKRSALNLDNTRKFPCIWCREEPIEFKPLPVRDNTETTKELF